jgi:hypothetical protein
MGDTMNEILNNLKSLSRRDLLRELRRVSEMPSLLLWEQVGYGSIYTPVSAGVQTAARLGVPRGSIIGYLVDNAPMGSSLSGLDNAVPQNDPPYPDPFR